MSHGDERERKRTKMGCFVQPNTAFIKKNRSGCVELLLMTHNGGGSLLMTHNEGGSLLATSN